ncbi:MAG: transposase [Clostridiales bacterium]|nr:transposase [Clostridiales bacterium]
MNVENFVIMPNHVHILLESSCNLQGSPRSSTPTNRVSNFVAALKKFTEKEAGIKLWQRSFHDHIIRDEEDYLHHIQYINENPEKWLIGKDEYYA